MRHASKRGVLSTGEALDPGENGGSGTDAGGRAVDRTDRQFVSFAGWIAAHLLAYAAVAISIRYLASYFQIIEIAAADGHQFDFSAMFDRIANAPRGREGGQDGKPGSAMLDDGTKMRPKGWQHVPPGRRLVLELPGGGGYGDPARRDPPA